MSKVRMVVMLDGRTYYGAHVYLRVKQFAEAYRVPMLPEELKTAPKWRKIIWKFEQLPVAKKLFIFREPSRIKVNKSQYVAKLSHLGVGKRIKGQNWRQPPRPREERPLNPRAERPRGDRQIRFVRDAMPEAMPRNAAQWGYAPPADVIRRD